MEKDPSAELELLRNRRSELEGRLMELQVSNFPE